MAKHTFKMSDVTPDTRLLARSAMGYDWNYAGDDEPLIFGTGSDSEILWSTGDASNHALVIAVGDTSQQIHITDLAAKATDWSRSAGTHPELAIHSNTTPATDYLAIGNHDGTTATIDVVGGTTLALSIAGTAAVNVTASGITLTGSVNLDLTTTGNRLDLDTDNDTSLRAIADDVAVIEAGGVDIIGLSNAALGSNMVAAADTVGAPLYIQTQDGGVDTAVDGGDNGGLAELRTGDGSAGGAAQAGGAGGALTLVTGAGGVPASGSANGGAGGSIAITAGAGGAAGAGGGTGGAGGTITLTPGAAGGAGGGSAGTIGAVLITGGRLQQNLTVVDDDSTNMTLAAEDINAGINVHTTVTGAGTVTTDTAANIISVCGLDNNDDTIISYYVNDGDQTATFAGGASVTVADTGNTVATNASATLLWRRVSGSTVTLYILQ